MATDLRTPLPPRDPRRLPRWVWRLILDVVDEYRRDRVGDLAASITFWAILSVPAAALAMVSTLSSLDAVIGASLASDFQQSVEDRISETFADADPIIATTRELFETNSTGLATFAMLVALYSLSRAFAGLIRALDEAYGVTEGRPWWWLRIVGAALGAGTVVIVAAAAVALAVVPDLPIGDTRWLTPPVVVAVVVLWASALFHFAPNRRTPWRYDLPGSIIATAGWLGAGQLFTLYVREVGGNDVRSAVGAILLALTLVHLLSIVLLVGAEVNDVIAQRAGIGRRRPTFGEHARRLRRAAEKLGPS